MILIVGAGAIAAEYSKILYQLGEAFLVVGRGQDSALKFEATTGFKVLQGGLTLNAKIISQYQIKSAIIAVNTDQLAKVSHELISMNVRHLLVEKPVGLYLDEVTRLQTFARAKHAKIFVAYNRRFLPSIRYLKDLIERDGGSTSLHFEFTELADRIATSRHPDHVKARWGIANSTHVIDLVFSLIGNPLELEARTNGGLDWHRQSSTHWGCGMSVNFIPFTYQSDWMSAGRWSITVRTQKAAYQLAPLEKIKMMKRGNFSEEELIIPEEQSEAKFKPGMYIQVRSFLAGEVNKMCTLDDHATLFPIYEKIFGYEFAG